MNDEYWALAPRDQIANEIESKWAEYHGWMTNTGLRDMLQDLYDAYYSFTEGGFGVVKSKNGSTAKIKVQHYKGLLLRIRSLVTQAKLTYSPKASNSNSTAEIQTDFSKGLLEYYETDKDITGVVSDMVETGLMLLDAYVYAPWDFSKGERIAGNHFTGDQVFSVKNRFDVATDTELEDCPYYIIRETKHKYELAAQYPEYAEAILSAGVRGNPLEYLNNPLRVRRTEGMRGDGVETFTLLHKKTAAIQSGRLVLICGGEVLDDVAFPYRHMPVVRFSPAKIRETNLGDSPATSIISIQQGIDALYSAVFSNNLQYSRQNIWSPSAIQVEPLSEGFNNIVSANKPEALQLVASSPETYNLISTLQSQQQLLTGVNDTARGSPEASLKSGTSLALMLSVSIQFVNETQKAYAKSAGELSTIIIGNLQEFANEPRLAEIGGISRKSVIKEFTKEDVAGVKLVQCEIGNPLTQNIAGRYELVQQWQQFGIVTDPKMLVEFLRTGQLDSLTEDELKDRILIRSENEQMRRGEAPIVMVTDIHPAHIIDHKALGDDPEVRKDPKLMQLLTDHIQDHIQTMQTMSPDLLAILGMQPLPSQAMQPPPQGGPSMELPPVAPGENPIEQNLPPLPKNAPDLVKEAYNQNLG